MISASPRCDTNAPRFAFALRGQRAPPGHHSVQGEQYDRADAILREVIDRYPGSDIARTAEDRLRSMQLTGSR